MADFWRVSVASTGGATESLTKKPPTILVTPLQSILLPGVFLNAKKSGQRTHWMPFVKRPSFKPQSHSAPFVHFSYRGGNVLSPSWQVTEKHPVVLGSAFDPNSFTTKFSACTNTTVYQKGCHVYISCLLICLRFSSLRAGARDWMRVRGGLCIDAPDVRETGFKAEPRALPDFASIPHSPKLGDLHHLS